MRKKITAIVVLAFSIHAFSQNCIPDTSIKSPGIYPEALDAAIVGTNYEFTMQVLALRDTVVVYAGQTINATIDSVSLDSIDGLPPGFTYACEAPSCVFDYTQVGCIKLSGNPLATDTGLYPLTIYTTAYARWGILRLPVPDTIEDYSLLVTENASASLSFIKENEVNVYPNPVVGETIHIAANRPIDMVYLTSMTGQLILRRNGDKSLIINVHSINVPSGLYLLTVVTDSGVSTRRVAF